MNIEYPRKGLFDIESKSEDEIIDVKNKSNSNDDDDLNVVNLNKNGEKVEETILDETDNTTSNNNEDVKDDKEYNIIEEYKVTPKYLYQMLFMKLFLKTNMNVFKDLLKNKK